MKNAIETLLTLSKAKVRAASGASVAIAKRIITDVIGDPTPVAIDWRTSARYIPCAQFSSHAQSVEVGALVDGVVQTMAIASIHDAVNFNILSAWLEVVPSHWVDWKNLSSWGFAPSSAKRLFTWDEWTRLAWIDDINGPRRASYDELEAETNRQRLDYLRLKADDAADEMEEALYMDEWTEQLMIDAAERMSRIELYLFEIHQTYPQRRRAFADSYLSPEIGGVYMEARTIDGFELMPPRKGNPEWSVEMVDV